MNNLQGCPTTSVSTMLHNCFTTVEHLERDLRTFAAGLPIADSTILREADLARVFYETIHQLKIIRLPGLSTKHTWRAFSILGGCI